MSTASGEPPASSETDTARSEAAWGDVAIEPGAEATRGVSVFSELVDAEGAAFEKTIAIFGVVISVVGCVVATTAIAIGRGNLGVPLLGLAVACTLYFGAVVRVIDRPLLLKVVRWLNPVVEMSIAPITMVILMLADGRAYALASWSPPMLYALMLFLQSLRLRPLVPVFMGVFAASSLALFYFVIAPAYDPTPLPDIYAFGAEAQLHRCLTLTVGGLCAGGMGVVVRAVLKRGADRLRSRELFGKYRIGPKVAEGGMGEVLLATYCPEGGFERAVAIKRIHPHLARNPRFVDAFRSEAELCARLNHPGIVQVMDFGRTEGTYFFAMELVEGLNLSQLIKRARQQRKPLPGGMVAFIGKRLANALHYAHEEAIDHNGERLRVVHRDLTPRNVLIGRTGVVKITDFGIARVLREEHAHHTQALMGSLAYLSPEQAQGDPIDPRSDLFSLGLILRELLTGKSLFKRDGDAATLRAVLGDPIPSLVTERNDVDPAWGEVLSKALRREPDRRFQTAKALGAALSGLHEREGRPGADALRAFLKPLLAGDDDAPELGPFDIDAPADPEVLTVTHDLRATARTAPDVDATRPNVTRQRPPSDEARAEDEPDAKAG